MLESTGLERAASAAKPVSGQYLVGEWLDLRFRFFEAEEVKVAAGSDELSSDLRPRRRVPSAKADSRVNLDSLPSTPSAAADCMLGYPLSP